MVDRKQSRRRRIDGEGGDVEEGETPLSRHDPDDVDRGDEPVLDQHLAEALARLPRRAQREVELRRVEETRLCQERAERLAAGFVHPLSQQLRQDPVRADRLRRDEHELRREIAPRLGGRLGRERADELEPRAQPGSELLQGCLILTEAGSCARLQPHYDFFMEV